MLTILGLIVNIIGEEDIYDNFMSKKCHTLVNHKATWYGHDLDMLIISH